MPEKSHFTQTIGLEWSAAGLKTAQLSLIKGKPHVDKLYFFPLEEPPKPHPQSLHNPLLTTEEGKVFLEQSKHSLLVSVLNANETLVRQLEIQLKKEKDIDAVLPFQAEPVIPYPIENAVIDRFKFGNSIDGSGTLLTLFAARKDHLQQHLERWKILEIEPEVISTIPVALAAFSKMALGEDAPHLVLHITLGGICCAYVKDGKLITAQSSLLGLLSLKQALQKDVKFEDANALEKAFKALDWGRISSSELPVLSEALENFRKETARIILAIAKQTDELQVPNILLTGEGAGLPILSQILIQDVGKPISIPQPLYAPQIPVEQLQAYAIPLGAALTALPGYPYQINFRQQEFSYPHPWRRLIKPFAIYGGLCVLLAVALYTFGESYARSREDDLRRQYSELLTFMNKPFSEFEAELGNTPVSPRTRGQALPKIESLSPADIRARLQVLDKEIRSIPDLFPISPNVPLVSDVLAWLSTHPKAVGEKGGIPLITIDSFSYTMVKRPDMTKKNEKYQVKVELEFSAANPTAARDFHDALIASNDFIDPKGDVKWSTNKGRYKAIFFLKDKTSYPSGGK